MGVKNCDPLYQIAEQVADCFAETGYAFVEDDKIDGLAALLGSFLTAAGIVTNPPTTATAVRRSSHDEPYPPVNIGKHAKQLGPLAR